MLHRAASNAFSWWWASHIRTKQSKWLEQHLQDMDEKVQYILKLIQEDGDSFAKRAEMYYKARPELINFVEESYKSYRALAERYDKISTDLQKANNTIASVFPEQVQLMEEDDEDSTPRYRREFKSNPPPRAPTAPGKRDVKGMLTLATKKLQQKKMKPAPPKSGLTKPEALKEIDRLQKGILALQTEKEFIKSSYELGLSRYWEIEKEITEMQEKNESLQDEFDASLAIEDEDARNLMATTALQSCQRTLDNLQKAQEETVEKVRVESQKVTEAREKLESFNVNQEKPCDNQKPKAPQERLECLDQAMGDSTEEEGQELKLSEAGLNSSLTMTEMAEKIDELVNKVVSLQTVVSSQTALVKRLRTETDELHTKIQGLEGDKETLTGTVKILGTDLRELEKQMYEKHDPNQNVESQNNHLQTHFTEALCNLDQLYDMLGSDKEDHELVVNQQEDAPNPSDEKEISSLEAKSQEPEEQDKPMLKNAFQEDKKATTGGGGGEEEDNQSEAKKHALLIGDNPFKALREQEDEPNWKQLFLDGMTDKEKTLLGEFTAMLKDYKEVKQKLGEIENKRVVQVKELEDVNAKKDADIQSLQKKLNHLRLHLVGETASRRSKDSDHQEASTLPDDQNAEPQASTNEDRNSTVAPKSTEKEENDEEDAKIILIDQAQPMSATEEKLRANIDTLLEENLDFWLRFSTSVHQIQKFQTEVEDLQTEVSTLKEKANKKHDTSGSVDSSVKSEVRPIYKHLKEKQTELSVWLEQNASLKEELQTRFSSLCNIREDITRTLKEGSGDEEIKFTSHQAAKLQGEVMNMQQENNKVAGEIQAGLDHVLELQSEVEKTLTKLNEEFGIAGSKSSNQAQLTHSTSRGRVPLQSFIFGVKQKKQKSSIFSCMNPSHRKYSHMKALPM